MNLQTTIIFGGKFLGGILLIGILSYSSESNTGEKNTTPMASRFAQNFVTQISSVRDTGIAEIRALLNSSDCYTCHAEYKILTAPSFSEIAARYKSDTSAIQKLMNKVIGGSLGTWGDRPMPAHPELLKEDVQKMIQYIMNLNKRSKV